MKIPEATHTTHALIDLAIEQDAELPRGHMGCSTLGHVCDRWLWLSFRWAVIEKFSGRMLRLFRRGQNEEAVILSDLAKIGVVLRQIEGQQRVAFGWHVSGSLDGIAESGIPEAPATPHVLEFKTHSMKSFDNLVGEGVHKAKPMHYVQMQVYMLGTGLDRALYVAVCKNDDRYYIERVYFDREVAEKAVQRGHTIVQSAYMPVGISTRGATWYECRFCAAHDFCYKSKTTHEINCRTCCHSTPLQDNSWHCARFDDSIPFEFSRTGCDHHALHPDLVPWEMDTAHSTEYEPAYRINGAIIINGASGQSSRDLIGRFAQ